MAESAEDICNMALAMLSEKVISDINDTTDTNSQHCRTYFQQAWDEVLEEVKPRAAQAEATLAQTNFTANTYQKSYRYQLPAAPSYCLKVLETNGKPFIGSGNRLLGRLIESADSAMFIRYVFRSTQYSYMSAKFTLAAAYNLASKISVPLQKSDTDRTRLIDEYEKVYLPRAIAEENQQDGAQDQIEYKSTWTGRSCCNSCNDDIDECL